MIQGKERAVEMTSRSQANSGRRRRFALFLLFACFIHERMTQCRLRVEAFGTSKRFSSWLARAGWCAKLRQSAGHDAATLRGGRGTLFGIPRQQHVLSQFASQIQLNERQRHNPTPKQKLAWRAYLNARPEQILLQKAQHMLFRETQAIAFRNPLQRHQIIKREKPTDTGITLGVASRGTLHPDHREHQIPILLEMHVIPAADPAQSTGGIGPLPNRLGLGLRLRARSLQQRTVLGERPSRMDAHWLALELTIAFHADQHAVSQLTTGARHFWGAIPAIRQHHHLPVSQEWLHQPHLLNNHPNTRLSPGPP